MTSPLSWQLADHRFTLRMTRARNLPDLALTLSFNRVSVVPGAIYFH